MKCIEICYTPQQSIRLEKEITTILYADMTEIARRNDGYVISCCTALSDYTDAVKRRSPKSEPFRPFELS